MAYKTAIHGRDHCPDGSDPIPCLSTWWAIVSDGWAQMNHNTEYPIGGQRFGTNDLAADYYTFNERTTNYPNDNGSENYYGLAIIQRGLYLIDARAAVTTSPANGWAEFRIGWDKEAWYPFGGGTSEDDSWVDRHVIQDATNGLVDSYFRLCGIASVDDATEFFPTVKQFTGSNVFEMAFNYLKVIRLHSYEALLRTGSLA